MNNEPDKLTFSQSYGYAELPTPLKLGELPSYARTQIWNIVYSYLEATRRDVAGFSHLGREWARVAKSIHGVHFAKPNDESSSRFFANSESIKLSVLNMTFNKAFDLLQFIMRHPACPPSFISDMGRTFERCRLAYLIAHGKTPTIIPAATQVEGRAIGDAMDTLSSSGLHGSLLHLDQSAAHINSGDWAASVRESIHAVESVARQLAPGRTRALAPALRALEDEGALHPALKGGFRKLYGYTCDEQGIRHALLDRESANVRRDEALFMLGACASFASYLWRKSQGGIAR